MTPTALLTPQTASSLPPATAARTLNVVQINTWDRVGGAARVARQLHEALHRRGHATRLVTGFGMPAESDASVQAIIPGWPTWKRQLWRATRGIEHLSSLQYLFSWWSSEVANHPWVRAADLVHLHNLHGGYFSHTVLPHLSRQKPIVWTLHDQWALTGHCGYAFDCERWRQGCGRCPQLDTYPRLRRDRTAMLWKVKQRVYARSRLTVVTPSRWLAQLARESPLLGRFPIHCIPNGIDTSVFTAQPRGQARARLQLPQGLRLLLFVAESLTERRKGGSLLIEALGLLPSSLRDTLALVTVGRDADQLEVPPAVRRFDLGVLQEEALPMVYSAVDAVVCPSLTDNLPTVLLEAVACGIPAVACSVGGIPEIIRHQETGYLASPGDAGSLAQGITFLLEHDELRGDRAQRCRRLAAQEFRIDLQVDRYLALYQQLLAQWPMEQRAARW
jgi:glycosyltransferase involved in cell wall biosynthesis